MVCRTCRPSRLSRLRAHPLLSHAKAKKTGMALLVLVLTACQHSMPATTSAPRAEDSVTQAAKAAPGSPPDRSAVVEELSARSRIPTSELQALLDDCERTQLSMNICAFRTFVASDLELDATLNAKRQVATPHCRAEMDRAHAAWQVERDRACNEETEAEEGGSMRPMLISSCKTAATQARIAFVKDMDPCARGR